MTGSQGNNTAWSWPVNQEIELGISHDPYWQTYSGQMDDFRVYSRVLLDSEIATIATPSSSDTIVDATTLQVRYNFDTAGVGQSLSWPVGWLLSSPTLGASAVWTTVNGSSPYPFLPPAPAQVSGTSKFYRVAY